MNSPFLDFTSFTRRQTGYTLIELMIAIVLGLLIAAAATQLFVTGYSSYALQGGISDVQDSGGFGLEYVARDIRLANLNAPAATSTLMTDTTPYSGVVLTSGAPVGSASATTNIPITPISGTIPLSGAGSSSSAATNPITISDQLVIQYFPQADGVDCEGNVYLTASNQYVVQQYFVRNDALAVSGEPNSLALVCRAGRIPQIGGTSIAWDNTSCGSSCGQIVMTRVEYFHVLLSVYDPTQVVTTNRYLSSQNYMALATPRPRIQAVQLAVLARALNSAGMSSQINPSQSYAVLDQVVTPVTTTGSKYVRQVFSTTVALRNGLG